MEEYSLQRIDNFREFYYEDKTNTAYYSDWDRILRYQKALGFHGIELAPWDFPEMLPLFGSAKAFKGFAAERGVEVSGMFHLIDKAHDRTQHKQTFEDGKQAVDLLVQFGGTQLNSAPINNYFGNGPLTRDQIKAAAEIITEIGKYATDKGVQIGIHNEFFLAINKKITRNTSNSPTQDMCIIALIRLRWHYWVKIWSNFMTTTMTESVHFT